MPSTALEATTELYWSGPLYNKVEQYMLYLPALPSWAFLLDFFDKAQVSSSLCVQCLWLCWIRQFNCIWKQNAGWLQCEAHWSVYVVACPEYRVPAVRYLKTRILITDWSELWSHDLWNDYMKSVLFCLFTWYLRFDRHQRMLFFWECYRESVTLHHCLYIWYYIYDSHCQINNQCQDQIPLVDYCVLFCTLIKQTVSIKQ